MTSGQATPDPAADGSGTVYLLHLDPPVKHARHYVGWTADLDTRLEAHRVGRGARLLEVVKELGGSFRLARTWPGSRTRERAIKNRNNAPRLCPVCTPEPQPVSRGRSASPEAGRQAAPAATADVVPEPDPDAWLRPWPGRPAAAETYADLMPLTDRLISGWQTEAGQPVAAEPDTEPELELLPPRFATTFSAP
jgi:hypothetical protein